LISKGIISFNPFIFKKEISIIHYPIVSKPIIPVFQYSNWGEASMFFLGPKRSLME